MVSLTTKGLFAEPYRCLSVGVATLGRYIGPRYILPAGAPARIQEEVARPTLLVTNVEYIKRKDEDNRPIKIIIKDVQ